MGQQNEMALLFDARSVNERFARMVVAAFLTELDPTLEELADVQTAVSEAVTNAIIHAYDEPDRDAKVGLNGWIKDDSITLEVRDWGRGIADIKKAMEPFYTTRPEWERSGMGFAFMEAFMDEVRVTSEAGAGTCVWMSKRLGAGDGTVDGADRACTGRG
jgi:stage II sporulation protein AB (anti-sigma F factor)